MARKPVSNAPAGADWYLIEWMQTLHVTQAKLAKQTGWSKATTNDIYHGRTSYYRQILNEAARALKISPHELLMHPDEAMRIRRLDAEILRVAADPRIAYRPPPPRDGTHG